MKETTSKSGSPIYHYKEVSKDWNPPVFDDGKTTEQIETHIEKYIGEIDKVFHELLSDTIHLDIYHVKPTKDRDYHTLITGGMSTLPMNPPDKFKDNKYAELMVCLPPSWDLSEEGFKDEKNYWPLRCLKVLARFPHEYKTWLWFAHTVPNGNPSTPFADNTSFCCTILFPPILTDSDFYEMKINEDKTIHFYAVLPLYKEEMNYKLKYGWEKLTDKFDKYGIKEIIDLTRKNVCKQSFWPFK